MKHTEKDIVEIVRRLESYGTPDHGNKDDPVDEIIYLILSKQTNNAKFVKAYETLKTEPGSWERLARSTVEYIAGKIREGGLETQKAEQILACLRKIQSDQGRVNLDCLRGCSDDDAFKYLMGLPGTGLKTAYCVMMYSLGRDVLPVDTHVYRISARLGLLPHDTRSKQAHAILNQLIPLGKKYSYHVNCISHGRAVCRTSKPKCAECIIRDFCLYVVNNAGE